jgi:hypothetical protein
MRSRESLCIGLDLCLSEQIDIVAEDNTKTLGQESAA